MCVCEAITSTNASKGNEGHPSQIEMSDLRFGSSLLECNHLLDPNSRLHGNINLVLSIVPRVTNFLRHGFGKGGKIDIGLLVPPLVHESELTLFSDIDDLPLSTVDDGDGGSVGGGDHILELLAGENVDGGEIAFGVAVLTGLGDRNVDDLAGLSFDHDVPGKLVQ